MSAWGMTILWCAMQVTLLAGTAAVLTFLSTRRSAISGSYLALACLAGVIVLTALAFCPVSIPWHWHQPASRGNLSDLYQASGSMPTSETALDSQRSNQAETQAVTGVAFRRLVELFATVRSAAVGPAPTDSFWPSIIALVAIIITTGCLLRLAIGLKGIRTLCQRSTEIVEPRLLATLRSIQQAMGHQSTIAVRESCDLGTAATVGWLRPVLLLPDDWRGWNEIELRAVLAHELAHVVRRDYAAGLLAQVALALHAYHPLVHWLVRHLHLQQELAADQLGARCVGGRVAYLTALARLALRQEATGITWPARAFLPAHGTLVRRIHMLRGKEALGGEGWASVRRWSCLTTLLGVTIGVSALREPAQAGSDKETPSVATKPAAPAPRQPFDCRFVQGDDQLIGVLAMRPSAILAYPGMKSHAAAINLMIEHALLEAQIVTRSRRDDPTSPRFDIAEIEEVVAEVRGFVNPKAPKEQQHSIAMNVSMIRSCKPLDWIKLIESRVGPLEERKYSGKSYYAHKPLPYKLHLFCPDNRTLVFASESSIRGMIDGSRPPLARPRRWDQGWKKVETNLFAMAVDFHAPLFKDLDEPGQDEELAEAVVRALLLPPILHKANFVVGITEWADKFWVQALFECDNNQSAEALNKELGPALQRAGKLLEPRDDKSTTPATASLRFVYDLFDGYARAQRGNEVILTLSTKLLFGDVVREFLAVEPKK